MKTKQIFNEFYSISNGDGYRRVGIGFKCKHCNTENNFVAAFEEVNCEYCGKLNKFSREEVENFSY